MGFHSKPSISTEEESRGISNESRYYRCFRFRSLGRKKSCLVVTCSAIVDCKSTFACQQGVARRREILGNLVVSHDLVVTWVFRGLDEFRSLRMQVVAFLIWGFPTCLWEYFFPNLPFHTCSFNSRHSVVVSCYHARFLLFCTSHAALFAYGMEICLNCRGVLEKEVVEPWAILALVLVTTIFSFLFSAYCLKLLCTCAMIFGSS